MKKLIHVLAIALTLTAITFAAPTVSAVDSRGAVCEGIGVATGGPSDCSDPSGSPTIDSTIKLVINVLSFVVGFVAVIMVIIGGFKYITSGGDAGNVTGAKNTILYAIIGLVIVVLAQVIVRFVLKNAAPIHD